ncbi:MAG: molybdopterin-guanine dinucleotide biosynthesis protein B [Rhodospirillales bacterium]|nr:MAG: molybdopterin-guanine dinucleotide biosynthesis protein B [Rhodospirillales bacterium]
MRLFGLVGGEETQRSRIFLGLVAELTRRGVQVATLHEAPGGFDPDRPGKDSYEHRKAGASEVLLMAPELSALMHENSGARPSPKQLAGQLAFADLVLIEGFEDSPHPKARIGAGGALCDASVVATLRPDGLDIAALADLALARAENLSP